MHAFEKSQSSKSAWSIMSRCIIMEDGFRKSLASLTDLNFLNWMLVNFLIRLPERIYNPIRAMGFSEMFTFQLDNTKR